MGNASSHRTDRRIPSVPHFAGEPAAFACCCKDRRTMAVEEKRKTPSLEATRAEEDLYFLLAYKRTKPRTCCSKMKFGLDYFFCELVPVVCPPSPRSIIHKIAFRPPERSTYDMIRFGGADEYRIHLRTVASELMQIRYRRCQAYAAQFRAFYITQKSGYRVACIYARGFSPNSEKEPLTVLYSHNNGIDLGLSVGYVSLMARRLRVNVLAYDYAGYGRSGGHCSESELYQSAEAAYEFVTKNLGVPSGQVVAIGTSLGTAATIHLASINRPLRGVVLQGGFVSALRVKCPNRTQTCQMDRFVNVDKIEKVKWPTLVVHGREDNLFSVAHAKKLRNECPGAKNIEPLIIDQCGHTDFDEFHVYWARLHKFLHMELTRVGSDGPCCTYHATEMGLRQSSRRKAQASVLEKMRSRV